MLYKLFVVSVFIFLAPLLFCIGLCLLVTSGWPILYRQPRVGKGGRVFTFYKFRTMQIYAEQLKKKYLKFNEADGPVFKIYNDPRFTKIGKFLSHTGLDELPQIFNILKGEMALVGPRPLPVQEVKQMQSWQLKRHQIKPGVISPWILEGYHRLAFSQWMRSDIEYASRKSRVYDLTLLSKSFRLIVLLFTNELKEILRSHLLRSVT